MNIENHSAAPTLSAWLRSARAPYLNFLRNLTPQIFLASLAWVIAAKLNFSKVDLANFWQTSLFFSFLALFAYAVYSNVTLFLSELFPTLKPWIDLQERELNNSATSKTKIPLLLGRAILRERKLEVALALFALIMLQVVLAGVFVSSIGAAVSFMHTVRH